MMLSSKKLEGLVNDVETLTLEVRTMRLVLDHLAHAVDASLKQLVDQVIEVSMVARGDSDSAVVHRRVSLAPKPVPPAEESVEKEWVWPGEGFDVINLKG